MICYSFVLLMRAHSDITLTFVFFNNVRLTTVRLVEFKSIHFELVARCPNQRKKTRKVSEIIVELHSQSQRFFANVSLNFSNSNNKRMTFAHVAIILSSTQRFAENLVALKI